LFFFFSAWTIEWLLLTPRWNFFPIGLYLVLCDCRPQECQSRGGRWEDLSHSLIGQSSLGFGVWGLGFGVAMLISIVVTACGFACFSKYIYCRWWFWFI
jgi:hypothetical protein